MPQLVAREAEKTPGADAAPRPEAAVPLREAGTGQLLHELLAKLLRGRIISGEWPAGSRIMSEHALMERYGVSRGTVRRAIGMLVDEGLLVQRKGKGTFVTRSGVAHPGGARPLSFAHALKEQGLAFKTQVLAKEVLPAPAEVAQELGLETGEPVLFMRRVRTVEGRAIVCQESWENLGACPGLADSDFMKESLFDAVERCSGHEIALSNMRSSATCAGKEHGGYLALPAEAPVLLLEQTISLDNHVPIEWSLTWLRSDQSLMGVALQDEMKRPQALAASPRDAEMLPKQERRRLDLLACDIREGVIKTAERYPDMPFHIGGAFSAAEIYASSLVPSCILARTACPGRSATASCSRRHMLPSAFTRHFSRLASSLRKIWTKGSSGRMRCSSSTPSATPRVASRPREGLSAWASAMRQAWRWR